MIQNRFGQWTLRLIGNVNMMRWCLNQDMLQCIDVVIYHVVMDGRTVLRKNAHENRTCVMPFGPVNGM